MAATSSVSVNPLDVALTESDSSIEINPSFLDPNTYYFFLLYQDRIDDVQKRCFQLLEELGNINQCSEWNCQLFEHDIINILCVSITDKKEEALKRVNSILQKEVAFIFKPEKVNLISQASGPNSPTQIVIPEASNIFYAMSQDKQL